MSNERFEENEIPTYLMQSAVQKYLFAGKFLIGKNVLDIGCGIGYGSKIMYDQKPHLKFFGCDKDESAIKYANIKYGKYIKFQKTDANSINFDDEYFDNIVSFETLEHISDGNSFIKELKRVLNKNGILIMSTPNRIYDEKVGQNINPFHETLYSKEELDDLLSSNFRYVQILGQKETFSEAMFKFPFLYTLFRKIKPILLPFFTPNNGEKIIQLEKLDPSFEPRPFWNSTAYLIAIASDEKLPNLI